MYVTNKNLSLLSKFTFFHFLKLNTPQLRAENIAIS